jgi:hypothetical protein
MILATTPPDGCNGVGVKRRLHRSGKVTSLILTLTRTAAMNRRTFNTALAGAAATSLLGCAAARARTRAAASRSTRAWASNCGSSRWTSMAPR